MGARPVGVAMSDGTIRPFDEVLGGITELARLRGASKGAVANWWSRSRNGQTVNKFPDPLFRFSLGPVWFPPDILGYKTGNGRWPKDDTRPY